MKTIQVDMFAVGLGAAVLTQFALEGGGTVAVLADGGMDPSHSRDGVRSHLGEAFDSFRGGGRRRRIDLIVGTHYDGDHLKGLLPIVQDEEIEIGEVWLPPIMNDTEEILNPLEPEALLAGQFFDEGGDTRLRNYLDEKASQVDELARLERDAVTAAGERPANDRSIDRRSLPQYRDDVTHEAVESFEGLRRRLRDSPSDAVQAYRTYFESHESDAAERTGNRRTHESATYDSRYPDAVELARSGRWGFRSSLPRGMHSDIAALVDRPDRLRVIPTALASIRQSVAAGAITATHLADIATALRKRSLHLRPRCRFVSAGRPSRFVWAPSKRRFVEHDRGGETPLILTLLGPSEELVEKHRARLPVGAYLLAVNYQDEPIRRENITASNQLSYIFTLEMANQRILVSGDAGCYGFKPRGMDYLEALLKPLASLHVVQIAHHAGYNYDFYNALLAAGFAQQKEPAFLLLSHAIRDKHRPSSAFREFVARLRRKHDDVSLLFTALPDMSKVEDYIELIHDVVPSGAESDEGDIRLGYQKSGKSGWIVERHAVKARQRRVVNDGNRSKRRRRRP
jgi:hypothetical protein